MSLEKQGWYLDKFGVERACLVVNSSMIGTVAVLDMDGQPLDVDPESVYYVPQNEQEGEHGE